MGFEVTYYYFERGENGKYNMEETKKINRKVGDPFDDISLEDLASQIMAQLSRRDIMIHDVEIFELSKKKISFRETSGGFIIKNKKFTLDQAAENLKVVSAEIQSVQTVSNGANNVSLDIVANAMAANNVKKNIAPMVIDESKPKAVLEYSPEARKIYEIDKKGFRFTVGKKYAILAIRDGNMLGIRVYTVKDDIGKLRELEDDCFIMPRRGLIGELEVGGFSANNNNGGHLMYQGQMEAEMPNLRQMNISNGPVNLPVESQKIMEQMAKAQEMPVLRPHLTKG